MLSAARILLACSALVSPLVLAAPLDAFLAADHHLGVHELRLETSYDAVNNTLDVFKIRAKDPVYGGTNVGDYQGAHLHALYAATERLEIDGGLWQRKISYRSDDERLTSWQAGMQYRLSATGDWINPVYALRLSAWGDRASTLNKSSPTVVLGRTLDSASVKDPQDRQIDLDFLTTWRLSDRTDLSAFIGAGTSRVSVGAIGGVYTDSSGCHFNLSYAGNTGTATLAEPCGGLLTASFSTAAPDVLNEVSYSARQLQFGGKWQWHNTDWRLSLGYQFQKLNRDQVDTLIASQGGTAYKTNNILVGEVARKIGATTAIFLRGQYMSNQFVGEIPFAYNSFTANKFASKYGLVSMGMLFSF